MKIPFVHVFGNSDIDMDALPILLLPQLRERFPDITFIQLDPNEEWVLPNPFVVIDTVVGIPDIHVFRSLDEFGASPTVSMHDFDALFNLRYLAKLGRLKEVCIIGVPPGLPMEHAFRAVGGVLDELILNTFKK